MESRPDRHYCPIFKRVIEEGLCWEISYAGSLIIKEAIPGLMKMIEKHKLTVKELQDKFCENCNDCQWKDYKERKAKEKDNSF